MDRLLVFTFHLPSLLHFSPIPPPFIHIHFLIFHRFLSLIPFLSLYVRRPIFPLFSGPLLSTFPSGLISYGLAPKTLCPSHTFISPSLTSFPFIPYPPPPCLYFPPFTFLSLSLFPHPSSPSFTPFLTILPLSPISLFPSPSTSTFPSFLYFLLFLSFFTPVLPVFPLPPPLSPPYLYPAPLFSTFLPLPHPPYGSHPAA